MKYIYWQTQSSLHGISNSCERGLKRKNEQTRMHEHLSVKSSMLLLAATIRIKLVALLLILHDSSKHVLNKCKASVFS